MKFKHMLPAEVLANRYWADERVVQTCGMRHQNRFCPDKFPLFVCCGGVMLSGQGVGHRELIVQGTQLDCQFYGALSGYMEG